jgi:hypothetical protein
VLTSRTGSGTRAVSLKGETTSNSIPVNQPRRDLVPKVSDAEQGTTVPSISMHFQEDIVADKLSLVDCFRKRPPHRSKISSLSGVFSRIPRFNVTLRKSGSDMNASCGWTPRLEISQSSSSERQSTFCPRNSCTLIHPSCISTVSTVQLRHRNKGKCRYQ